MCPANVPSLPPRLVAGCRRLPVVPGYQQLCDIRERVSDWGVRRRPTVPRPDPPVFDMNHRYGAKSHPNSRDLLHAVRVLRRLADHHAGRQAAGPSAARLTGPRRAHPDARVRCPASSRHRQVGCLHPVGLIPFVGGIILLVFFVMDSSPATTSTARTPRASVALRWAATASRRWDTRSPQWSKPGATA